MKTVKVLDKEFGLYIPQEKIEANIQVVANQINKDLDGMNPLFLVVLNGAFMFASELFKRLTIPCEISFVKLSSYAGTETTNVIRELIGECRRKKRQSGLIRERDPFLRQGRRPTGEGGFPRLCSVSWAVFPIVDPGSGPHCRAVTGMFYPRFWAQKRIFFKKNEKSFKIDLTNE